MEGLVYGVTIMALLSVNLMALYFRFYRTRYYKESDWGDVVVFHYAMGTGLLIPLLITLFGFHLFR